MSNKRKQARTKDWYDKIWKTVGKCVFCDLEDKYIIFEKNGIVLTSNLYPYIDAHLLIVPRRHIEYVKELTKEEWQTVNSMMYISKKIIRKLFKVKNVWFLYREGKSGEAQKSVAHLHIHAIPFAKELFKINFRQISISPEEVSAKMRSEEKFLEKKFDKFLFKYGKYSQIEKRVVVNVLIFNSNEEIVLVKKKNSINNKWETPAGSVERDEGLEKALKREVKEEVNLKIKNIKFLGIDEDKQDVLFEEGFVKKWRLIFINYTAKVKSGRLKAGDDAEKAKWVNIKNLYKHKISKITKNLIDEYNKLE